MLAVIARLSLIALLLFFARQTSLLFCSTAAFLVKTSFCRFIGNCCCNITFLFMAIAVFFLPNSLLPPPSFYSLQILNALIRLV